VKHLTLHSSRFIVYPKLAIIKEQTMAFKASLEITSKGIAKITLVGELDGSVAPEFKAKIEDAVAQKAKRLVLLLQDLEYMSSAGLRVLVFAKQKMGSEVDIYVVGAQEQVIEPITMTGLQHSLVIVDKYDAKIEKL
jgi:anti-anti-sigma factor